MNEVEIVGLHKAFDRRPVIVGADLVVPKGSLTALLGPSGSGKTTLLRILAGLERPDAGTIRIGEVVVDDSHHSIPPEQRSIGYVPQDGALFPHLTVEHNVSFGLSRPLRKGGQVGELLELVGLAGLGARFPHQLSGGQQQRVALARALAIHPRLVLLDEPFSSLDVGLRASVRADVQCVLREAGATALLVTHDQDEALSMADRVAVISDGAIGQCGTPQELYDEPVSLGIARFLGEANLIDGTLDTYGQTPGAPDLCSNGEPGGGMAGLAIAGGGFGAVTTALGTLRLRRPVEPPPHDGRVVVLVRPEQLDVTRDDVGYGLRGLIARSEFHGHDAVVTVTPTEPCGMSQVVVRTAGGSLFSPDESVVVTVRGTAVAWPSEQSN